jgi:hypothetical protein
MIDEKMIEKLNGIDPIRLNATDDEKLFIEKYLECKNATAAAQIVWPVRCKKTSYASVLGCEMVKKFNLKGKDLEKVKRVHREAAKGRKREELIVPYVKDLYLAGQITEEELVKRMARISERSLSEAARFNATKELREWLKEAKEELEANRLSEVDIIPLMIAALVELPREKYIKVLLGMHKKRSQLSREKNKVFDADKIREMEKARRMGLGEPITLPDDAHPEAQPVQ